MDCAQTRDRMVAWRDAELSPGEHEFVTRHLADCPRCAALEAELAAATPAPRRVGVPARHHARFDVDALLAEADREPAPAPLAARISEAARAAWRWEARVTAPAAVAYAAALALALGVALAGWWSDAPTPIVVDASPALPASAYAPASYAAPDPEDGAEGVENDAPTDEQDGFR